VSGTSGRTADPTGTTVRAARVTPPIELPAPAQELAVAAADRLGWRGTVLPEMTFLGRKVNVVAELLPDVHAERICLGHEPVTDRHAVSTWVWPEFNGLVPEQAVRIIGVISVQRHWRTGLACTVPFLRYCDAAVVLPTPAVITDDYVDNGLPRARAYGVAVLSAEQEAAVAVDLAGRGDRMFAGFDANYRWLGELAYEQLLGL
jgi:hypothetical protein